jgi:hypothetical protein
VELNQYRVLIASNDKMRRPTIKKGFAEMVRWSPDLPDQRDLLASVVPRVAKLWPNSISPRGAITPN